MEDRFFRYFYLIILVGLLLIFSAIADASTIETLIRTTAVKEGVDPDLAVAIAKVESRLNVKAVGSKGEIGLYQLRPEFHKVQPGDVVSNVRTAIRYLRYLEVTCAPKYGDAWFICYNLGENYSKPIRYPKLFKYYVRVKSEMNRIAKAD